MALALCLYLHFKFFMVMITQSIGLRYGAKKSKFEKSDSKLDTVTEEIWIDCNFVRQSSTELENINKKLNIINRLFLEKITKPRHINSSWVGRLYSNLSLTNKSKVVNENMKVMWLHFVLFLVLYWLKTKKFGLCFPSAEACYCLSIMMAGVVKNIRCLS